MASLIEFHKAVAQVIPEGWTYEIDEPSLGVVVITCAPGPSSLWDDWLLVRRAIEESVEDLRPVGVEVRVERVAAPEPAVAPEEDEEFVRTMRALRGDFGSCGFCGEAFGEHEKTTTDGEKTVHPGCVVRAPHCAGCRRPVVMKERWTTYAGETVHADCVQDAETRAVAERERRAAQARKEERQRTRAGLIAEAVEASRKPGAVVALVVSARDVESEAQAIVRRRSPSGWFATNKPHQKAIAWRDSTGMLVVESAAAENVAREKKGYTLAFITSEAMRNLPGLPEIVARCFGLKPSDIVLESR